MKHLSATQKAFQTLAQAVTQKDLKGFSQGLHTLSLRGYTHQQAYAVLRREFLPTLAEVAFNALREEAGRQGIPRGVGGGGTPGRRRA